MNKSKFNYELIYHKIKYAIENKKRFSVFIYTTDPLKYASVYKEDFGLDSMILTINHEGIKIEIN